MVLSSMGARRPAFWTVVIAGEFSVRKTSAGDWLPSWTICAAIADLDLGAGLVLEGLRPGLGEVLVLGAVDGELRGVQTALGLEAGAAARREGEGGSRREDDGSGPSAHHAGSPGGGIGGEGKAYLTGVAPGPEPQ